MRVLVVEDDIVSAELVANSLRQFGYEVNVVGNGCEALELVHTGRYRLLISDWEMPEMSGVELCRKIRARKWNSYIYVILLTSYAGVDKVVEGLSAGADDFLTKPFHPEELRVRLHVVERILGLESRDVTIFSLAKLAESRDEQTGAHLERMREYCRILAEELSHADRFCKAVDGDYTELLYATSPLHDIGKVGIPDSILLKPGKLTTDEFEVMKQHTVIGWQTLAAASRAYPDAQFLTMARDVALTHHERFDGKGYPQGLKGEDIPICGRITALADVYDALTSKRVYKEAFSHETARTLILEGQETQFDPDVVRAFLRREQSFIAIAAAGNATSSSAGVLPSMVDAPALGESVVCMASTNSPAAG